jgi:hypothetical protein
MEKLLKFEHSIDDFVCYLWQWGLNPGIGHLAFCIICLSEWLIIICSLKFV